MLKLQGTFIREASGDIRVYGMHKKFDKEIQKVKTEKLGFRDVANICGLKGIKAEKNLWEWRNGKSGIPLSALRNLMHKSPSLESANVRFGERRSKHLIKLPVLNETVAYLTALINGDGNIQQYFIRIVDEHAVHMRFVKKILGKCFGVPIKIRREAEKKWLVEINSKVIAEFFDKVLKVPVGAKNKIEIPDVIKNASSKVKFAYIRGWMDAEGSVEKWYKNESKWYVRINFRVKNRNICEWIAAELAKIGVMTSISEANGIPRMQIAAINSVAKYQKMIGFDYRKKREKLCFLIGRTKALRSQQT